MLVEESKHARNHRIAYRLAYRTLAAILTIGIITMDMYVIFSSTVAHRQLVRDGENPEAITLDIGPLMTRLCHNTTHHGGFGEVDGRVDGRCITVLFYQIPIDDYVTSSAMMMLALWVPIMAGLILSRLTFWKVHAPLQFIVSMGYMGVVYILLRDGYTPGLSVGIIAGRLIWVSLGIAVTVFFIVYKCCHEKYCLDVSDTPTLIGVAYSPRVDGGVSDDDDDVLSARYWHNQRISDE
jgi:hypothetical protein